MYNPNVKTRYEGKRAKPVKKTSMSLRSGPGGGAGAPSYADMSDDDDDDEGPLWNGKSRPGFTEDTLNNMFRSTTGRMNAAAKRREYQCEHCEVYFPRKGDSKAGETFITIDHKTPWQVHIWKTGAPNKSGKITKEGAKEAYNALTNLRLLCCSCNSSKSGYGI